jgi:hypothetical protein
MRKSGRVALSAAPDSGDYFNRLLGLGRLWGGEIGGDTELSGEIGRNVLRLSALLSLANGISAKVPQ